MLFGSCKQLHRVTYEDKYLGLHVGSQFSLRPDVFGFRIGKDVDEPFPFR